MTQIWFTRDLPVLRAVVEMTDDGSHFIEPHEIATRLGMDHEEVIRSLRALSRNQPALFRTNGIAAADGIFRIYDVSDPTGLAREKVGVWPTPESVTEQIVEALKIAAENEVDPAKRSKLAKMLDAATDLGTNTLGAVFAGYLAAKGLP